MGNLYSVRQFFNKTSKTPEVKLSPFHPVQLWKVLERNEDGKVQKDSAGNQKVKEHMNVVLLGDTARRYFGPGKFTNQLVKPYSKIPLAKGNHKPRLSGRDHDRAVEGTYMDANVDGKLLKVLLDLQKDDRAGDVAYAKIRSGFYPDSFGRINRSFNDHVQEGYKVGCIGSFLFGGENDTLTVEGMEASDEVKNLDRSHAFFADGGLVVHHGLYRLRRGSFIVGVEANDVIWKLENTRDGVQLVDGADAEMYRPDFMEREEERRELAAKARKEKEKRDRAEADRRKREAREKAKQDKAAAESAPVPTESAPSQSAPDATQAPTSEQEVDEGVEIEMTGAGEQVEEPATA